MQTADPWRVTELGGGIVRASESGIRMVLPRASSDAYSDAQISDYATRADFSNWPPLRLSLCARFQGELKGTAGFGFWNHAFMPGQRSFRLPQALWFLFTSRENDIELARGVAGNGWKAAAINARDWRFLALLPFAPLGFLLMRSRVLYDTLWPIGQRAIGVSEAMLDKGLLRERRRYSIDWQAGLALFAVDGEVVHQADNVAKGPLGFIAWIDNQYMVLTPQGKFKWGLLAPPGEQSLELSDIQITGAKAGCS